jgi:hypothetical protein
MVQGYVQQGGGGRVTLFNYYQPLSNGAAGKTAEGGG